MFVTLTTLIQFAIAKTPVALSRLLDAWCEGIAGFFFRRETAAPFAGRRGALALDSGRARRALSVERSGFRRDRRAGGACAAQHSELYIVLSWYAI